MKCDYFSLNGDVWQVDLVEPGSLMLVDRTRKLTVATTDPVSHTVYLSNRLQGELLVRVMIHELGHCALFSFDLLDEIHRMVRPEYWMEAEEWVCNFIADYGLQIFQIVYKTLGYKAWKYIPKELERWIA